jgi:hypothetical protein
MGSSGKKKTTMAKLARENRLRERRLNKQAKKDARKQDGPLRDDGMGDPNDQQASAPGHSDEAVRAFRQIDPEPTDPRAKEVALRRLHDAPDEELAVFEGKLRDDALQAGASEREMREAQRDHPGHGAG